MRLGRSKKKLGAKLSEKKLRQRSSPECVFVCAKQDGNSEKCNENFEWNED